ncbi:hypothetical protein DENSPDRAFT_881563 [Dentipellis sp. KUC8613]|nr:hypothetical protein DENSPDRAFT_881563 [Dentipellis sp. KUC8613]
MSATPAQAYVHPDPHTTVLPHVLTHLPHALHQENLINIPPSSLTIVLASYPPSVTSPPSHPWAVGILDLSRPNEAEFFFWCSEENRHIPDEGGKAKIDRFRGAYSLLEPMLTFVAERHPDKKTLQIGSLNVFIVPFLNKERVHRITEIWAKLIFSKNALPPLLPASQARAQQYIFEKVHPSDLDDVLATSTVERKRLTLARLSSTGAYPIGSPTSAAHAWCFTTVEGSVSTLYVRPKERGRGLGTIVMRQELEKGFKKRKFVSADVSLMNEKSAALCASLGARKMWETVWVWVNLDGFRRK